MEFSKAYKKANEKYNTIVNGSKKAIKDILEAIPVAETALKEAESSMKDAAAAGNEKAYQEARGKEMYNKDRLDYLNKRLSSLQNGPLTSEAESRAMLEALEKEQEALDEEYRGTFSKLYLSMNAASEDLISRYTVLEQARANILRNVSRKEYNGTRPQVPDLLWQISNMTRQKIMAPNGIKADYINLDTPDRRPITDAQRKELQAELAKWD